MKKEENVYEETTRSEETTTVREEERASAVPSKFKDVDALARAYDCLQAEFTRRSQRLKELEKRLENLQSGEASDARLGVEKLRKSAKARKEETKQFDEFVEETVKVNVQETMEKEPESKPNNFTNAPEKIVQPEEVEISDEGTVCEMNANSGEEAPVGKDEIKGREDRFEQGEPFEERVGESVLGNEEKANDSARLYELAKTNEAVRLKIIGDYLATIGKSNAPLMTGGVGLLATPPKKAKSISDAGNMALLYFKKPIV